jgi:hypothetical protein
MSEILYLLLLLNNFEGAQRAHSLSVEHLRTWLSIFDFAPIPAPPRGRARGMGRSGGFLPPSPPAEKATAGAPDDGGIKISSEMADAGAYALEDWGAVASELSLAEKVYIAMETARRQLARRGRGHL